MGVRRFSGCQFGPFALRLLLRAHMNPGERLVGWGLARKCADTTTTFWIAAMHLAPGVGHGIGAMMAAQLLRWIVLTDQRLLVMGVGRNTVKPGKQGLKADVSLGEALIERTSRARAGDKGSSAFRLTLTESADKFVISWDELGKTQSIEVKLNAKSPRSHKRLGVALGLLAQAMDEEGTIEHEPAM